MGFHTTALEVELLFFVASIALTDKLTFAILLLQGREFYHSSQQGFVMFIIGRIPIREIIEFG